MGMAQKSELVGTTDERSSARYSVRQGNTFTMMFQFDIKKTLAASAWLSLREGGQIDVLFLIKMLYRADRSALNNWGRPITGDSFCSMNNGPVLSHLYNLIKGTVRGKDQAEWDAFFTRRDGNHIIRLIQEPEIGYLSEREIEALEVANREIKAVPTGTRNLARWMHSNCPEWEDPKGSSIPIDPSTILRKSGKTEDEIQRIEEENDALRFAKTILG